MAFILPDASGRLRGMAEKDDKPLDVNLELPSFGLRRKRKDKKADEVAAPPAEGGDETPAATAATAGTSAPSTSTPPAAPPAATAESSRFAPPAAPASPAAPSPVAAPADARDEARDGARDGARDDVPAVSAPTSTFVEDGDRTPPQPVTRSPLTEAPAPAPLPPVTPAGPAAPAAPVAAPVPAAAIRTGAEPTARLAPELADEAAAEAPPAPETPRFERARLPKVPVPNVGARKAAAFTGVLIGLLACGATWLSLQGCEAIRGTSSCGGPGFLLLLVILVLLVVVGAAVLKLLRVADHAATSFLAVGLLAMLVLLVLTSWIFEWWIVLIIPPLAAGTFMLAQWVTSHAGTE